MSTERRTAVQGCGLYHLHKSRWSEGGRRSKYPGSISWEEHLEVWKAYNKEYPGQSAERIAQRGGFGYFEAIDLLGRELRTWLPNQSYI